MANEIVMQRKVLEALGGQKVLGFVSGCGLKSFATTLVVTENGVFIYDPRLIGVKITSIPFAQITAVFYGKRIMGFPHLYIEAQTGSIYLRLSGNNTHAATLRIFYLLRDRLSELSGVPISELHEKGVGIEAWSFLAPEKISTIQA